MAANCSAPTCWPYPVDEGQARAGAPAAQQRARTTSTCCRPASPAPAPPRRPDASRPTWRLPAATSPAFRAGSGVDELRVPLKWTSPDGVDGHQDADLPPRLLPHRRGIRGAQRQPTRPGPRRPTRRSCTTARRSSARTSTSTATRSPARRSRTARKYEKLKITDKEDASLNRDITGGWLASLQHHFVAAIVPPQRRRPIATR